MKKTILNFFIITSSLGFIFLLQSSQYGNITPGHIKSLQIKLLNATLNYPQEKIYLHLDRSSYWANEDIWFKAYLMNSPDTINNINVELIHSSGKIIERKLFLAINGIAYGDFHLADTTSSGIYQIRAYTNWMRNFDESWFFRKDIVIWNLKDKQVKEETRKIDKREFDVQFFPEGGTMLADVPTVMAFKATIEKGRGTPVSGKIVNEKGLDIQAFQSDHKGMGSFQFTPKRGEKYFATINYFGDKQLKIDLPVAQNFGVSLSISYPDKHRMKVSMTEKKEEDSDLMEYVLIGQTRGIVFLSEAMELKDGKAEIELDKQNLPSGVIQFTLFNQMLQPLCERLVFVNNNTHIDVDINPDKKDYKTQEIVNIDIKTLTKENLPELANLSISVYNPVNLIDVEKYPNNILTHFLLNSDLKGHIEEPAFYFKDDSLSTLKALDNLMLTQGWRRFVWKELLANKKPNINYYPESSITLEGKVSTIFGEKPIDKGKVSLFLTARNFKPYEQLTDSLGRFFFDNLLFYNETPIMLNAEKPNGSRRTWIEISDYILHPPKNNYLPLNQVYKNETVVNTTFELSQTHTDLIKRKWNLSDTILLEEVYIFGLKKIEDNRYSSGLNVDYSVKISDEDYLYSNVYEMIAAKVPGVYMNGETILLRGKQPLFVLDGIPARDGIDIPMEWIERIDKVNFAPLYGEKGQNGVIFIYTKRGIKNGEANLPRGTFTSNLKGYSIIREFYSPNYEKEEFSVEKDDFRSTLYWHPNIYTDSVGNVSVSFYNSDQPGEIQIIVEGISTNGKLCRGIGRYRVGY